MIDFVDVHSLAVDRQDGVDVVKIRVVRAPEARRFQRSGRSQNGLFAIDHINGVAFECGANLAGGIHDHRRQCDRGAIAGSIAHFRVHGDIGGFAGDVEVRGVNIDTGAFEAVVQRQRLIDLAGDVQPDMPVDAAVVGIEVVRVPFERGTAGALRVVGAVVDLYRQHVFLASEVHGGGDVHSVRGHSVFVKAHGFAVQENVAGLPHALEFQKDVVSGKFGGQLEVFPVPDDSFVCPPVAAAVRDDRAERIDVVERMRRADGDPGGVVEGGGFGPLDIVADELPVEVEIDFGPGRCWRSISCGDGKVRGEEQGDYGCYAADIRRTQERTPLSREATIVERPSIDARERLS